MTTSSSSSPAVVILGCGYTGKRVALRMLGRGARVLCTSRDPSKLQGLSGCELRAYEAGDSLDWVPEGALVLHSIPPVDGLEAASLIDRLGAKPSRVVYLSTTGVYGEQRDVDEQTSPSPRHERDVQRLATEKAVQAGPWSSLVLRPAAIYGPGRGIHVSMAEGRFRLVGSGNNFVSRIHVDDLAAHAEAGLLSEVGGAWPVADEHPCTSLEIAAFCSELLGVPLPDSITAADAHHTRTADRRVDGRAIRQRLGIALSYPDYKAGIRASLK